MVRTHGLHTTVRGGFGYGTTRYRYNFAKNDDSQTRTSAALVGTVLEVAVFEGELGLLALTPPRLVVKVHVGALLVLARNLRTNTQ